MSEIGILAYGSLIEDPGPKLKPFITRRIENIETPFQIEFARTSKTRDGAPTVVPVDKGGSSVRGTILFLKEVLSIEQAMDLLWRRETRNECSDMHYEHLTNPGVDQVVVEKISDIANIDIVLYTRIRANIKDPNAKKLASLAIKSAKGDAGANREDGISYLLMLKRQNISTPLMQAYEEDILHKTGTSSLEDALKKIRKEIDT